MILSGNLAAAGYNVSVIDADPNSCYFQWHKLYEGTPIDCTCEIQQEELVDLAQSKAATLTWCSLILPASAIRPPPLPPVRRTWC